MKTEFEIRVLDISFGEMIAKLEAHGAKRAGAFVQKRFTYDFTPPRKGQWVRLRTNGRKTTLAIKEIKAQSIDGTKELEVEVSDFDDTNLIMEKLGYKAQNFQENFRISYKFGDVEIDLDKWPLIPPYMEIEGKSEADVYVVLKLLGIDAKDTTALGTDALYKEKYGINLSEIEYLKFSDEENNFISKFN